jgi:hypothetical protein
VEDDVDPRQREAVALAARKAEPRLAGRMHVAERAAAVAAQMLMSLERVRVVALHAIAGGDFADLTERGELAEHVVHGRSADLGQADPGALVELVGAQVQVRAF